MAPKTGRMLALLRDEAEVTQKDLAGRLGVSRSQVATAERGLTRVSVGYLRIVVDELRIDANRAIVLLETYAEERGFVFLRDVGEHLRGAIVAAIERERRLAGERAVCPACGASTVKPCAVSCGTEAAS